MYRSCSAAAVQPLLVEDGTWLRTAATSVWLLLWCFGKSVIANAYRRSGDGQQHMLEWQMRAENKIFWWMYLQHHSLFCSIRHTGYIYLRTSTQNSKHTRFKINKWFSSDATMSHINLGQTHTHTCINTHEQYIQLQLLLFSQTPHWEPRHKVTEKCENVPPLLGLTSQRTSFGNMSHHSVAAI